MVRLRFATLLLAGVALAACSGNSEPANMVQMRAAERELSGDLDVQIRRAQILRSQGNYVEATRAISQMMLAMPDDPRVVGEYGKLLAQQGDSKDAVAFLRRATELNSNDWTLFSALGVSYDQINDPNAARASYDRALALKPGDPTVLNNYAMSRMMANDLPQAARLIAQARMGGSTDPKIQRNAEMIASLMPPETAKAMTVTPALAEAPRAAPLAPVTRNEAPRPAMATTTPTPTQAKPNPVMQQSLPTPPVATEAPRQPTSGPRALQPQQMGAKAAPQQFATTNSRGRRVVMQEVPFDPLAGPVGKAKAAPVKAAPKTEIAKAKAPARVAKSETERKPVKVTTEQAEPSKIAEAAPAKPSAVAPVKAASPKTDIAKNDAPKGAAKTDAKAASSKPEPEAKPVPKPSKPRYAESKTDDKSAADNIPRLRMAADMSEP